MGIKECPICGKWSLRSWTERDVDGNSEYDEECINPNCGEESSSDDE